MRGFGPRGQKGGGHEPVPSVASYPSAVGASQPPSSSPLGTAAPGRPEQAVELVSSAKVLESVTGDQATEVFGAVDEGALTAENGEQITAAVQEAPVAVRDAFQEEINVFGGVFDGYYPLGSMIDVGTRRVVVAGTGVLISAPVVASRRGKV